MIQVFVNKAHVTNIACAAIAYLKWRDDVVFHDLQIMPEQAITDAIAAIDAASQDAIVVCADPVAAYVAAGDITNAQVASLDAKIKATAVAPFNVTVVLSLVASRVSTMWENCFPSGNAPLAVRFLTRRGVEGYVEVSATNGVIATDGVATTITVAGLFANLSLVGMYACFQGVNNYHVTQILSHTDNALTLAILPGENIAANAAFEVVANPEEAFMSQFIEIGMKSKDAWGLEKDALTKWMRLLDLGAVDPSKGKSFALGQRQSPLQDLELLKELKDFGTKTYKFARWNNLFPTAWF